MRDSEAAAQVDGSGLRPYPQRLRIRPKKDQAHANLNPLKYLLFWKNIYPAMAFSPQETQDSQQVGECQHHLTMSEGWTPLEMFLLGPSTSSHVPTRYRLGKPC